MAAASVTSVAAKFSNAQQDSYIAQGLALGVLAAGIEALPADKLSFEFALSRAWRNFAGASLFPRVGHPHAADPYYALLSKSERRKGPLMAAWAMSNGVLAPYVWMDQWDVDESGEMLANWTGVSWDAWKQLGSDLVDYYREREKI